ncbi:hypothetical protein [Tropicimonas aquimaris]|uniref:Uncharacterized protein n=1 Tax=Tropicimonas aquimaris TaxID=914152 RepID=A0ABW3ITL4_9RHOB
MIGGENADTFLFSGDYAKDVVLDFEVGLDIIRLDYAMWNNGLTNEQIVRRVSELEDGDTVFTFGENLLTLNGIGASFCPVEYPEIV